MSTRARQDKAFICSANDRRWAGSNFIVMSDEKMKYDDIAPSSCRIMLPYINALDQSKILFLLFSVLSYYANVMPCHVMSGKVTWKENEGIRFRFDKYI